MHEAPPHNEDDTAILREIAHAILDPAKPKGALVRQATRLRELVERRSTIPSAEETDLGGGQTRLDSGLAISPMKAALCARECFRTIAFIKGLGAAIADARQPGRATRVLYAGCGPFALLALPLMSVFSPQQAVFTLIDIHADSLRCARDLIDGLGFSEHVDGCVCDDATRYRIPSDALPDVIVAETMNVCLRSEPQVTIARHLLRQAPDARMVPSAVRVEACLMDTSKEFAPVVADAPACMEEPERDRIYLGTVFELSAQTINAWAQVESGVLPAASIVIPTPLPSRYQARLLTRISVYGGSCLLDYESSLNLPRPLPGKPQLKGGEELRFRYRLGSDPGLVLEMSA